MPIIEVNQLTRRFRVPVKVPGFSGAVRHLLQPRFAEKIAVDANDLRVEVGESVVYVGPNGAGKSTTLKMLSTTAPPLGSPAPRWPPRRSARAHQCLIPAHAVHSSTRAARNTF